MKAQCIVFPEPLKATVGEVEVPSPGKGQLLCRTRLTGVSTGTETRVFRGKQEGAKFPLIPGYENLGEVIEAGEGTTVKPGTRLLVRTQLSDPAPYARSWGAQVSHTLTDEGKLVVVPENVSDERAIYAKVAGISLHGVKRAKVASGEWVVVVGLGLIGHLVVQHCVAKGAQVIAVDMAEDRLELAKKAGALHTLSAGDKQAVEKAHGISGGGADVAFDATGLASVLEPTSLYLKARAWDDDPANCGRLVLQGTVEDPVTLDYMALFRREIDLITPRDCDTQDMIDSLDLMAADKLHPEIIPASRYSFRDCAEAYPKLVSREIMRVLYTWE
ncbi:MAG: zinc-dependent alcohol dehydrogenase [bacterium]